MPPNVPHHPRAMFLRASEWMRWLCRSLEMIFPSREYQHGRMAFEGFREHLCAFNAKANTVVLDGGKSGLRDTRALRDLVLAQALQLSNNAHGLANRDSDALLRRAKLLHLRPPIIMRGDCHHLK